MLGQMLPLLISNIEQVDVVNLLSTGLISWTPGRTVFLLLIGLVLVLVLGLAR